MTTQKKSNKALHITLWIAQGLLAAMFIMAGFSKVMQPIEQLSAMAPWTSHVPAAFVRFIGTVEFLGGLGLILPAALRIKPELTAWAAVGLATVMIMAMGYHIFQGEAEVIGINIILALAAAFVAWGRFKKAPIYAKG